MCHAAAAPEWHAGKDAAELLTLYLELYGQCAARHNTLVDEINLRENIIYGKN